MVACLSCDYRGHRGVWVAHSSLSGDSLFSPELQQLCILIILGQVVSFGTLPGFDCCLVGVLLDRLSS